MLVPGEDDEDGEPTQIPVLMPAPSSLAVEPSRPCRPPPCPPCRRPRAGAPPGRCTRVAAPAVPPPDPRRTPTRAAKAPTGALTGSVLSPDTWRQALAAAMGKAS